ncbi:transcription-repair coupling factor [Sinimarinibacterium sp. NLF-5-8]|uniref:transcription-repair coupling factor n=1 Tax=Sinimarinibacterium sp. NLF-5-8 TaxID=2698684 RepID=UPI00137BFE63|nr:transcription-repair coupling factor [Sinimarinibacterium sp. NLF-5-8]QHS09676.1 transcription-repair coupling factor [Sinimarinibacterium sp. NLF-5-8]
MSVDSVDLPVTAPACPAFDAANAAQHHSGLTLILVASEQMAYRLADEIRFFLPPDVPLTHLPNTEVLPYDPLSPHQEVLSERIRALHQLPQMARGVLLTTVDQLLLRLPPKQWLDSRAFELQVGQTLDPLAFRARLIAAGYNAVSEVQTQGEFAVRGALIDLFPMGSESAYRIDLFDDDIDSIRTFDPETQRSTDKVAQIRLLPAREFPLDKDGIDTFRRRYREYFPGDPARSRIYTEVSKGIMPGGIEAWLPLFFSQTAHLGDYLPANTQVLALDDVTRALDNAWQHIQERHTRYSGDLQRPLMLPQDAFFSVDAARAALRFTPQPLPGVPLRALGQGEAEIKAELAASDSRRTLFVAESAGRREALLGWLKNQGIGARAVDSFAAFVADNKRFGITLGPIHHGFALDAENLQWISEAQVFGQRVQTQYAPRRRNKIRDPETVLRDLSSLTLGAPVVHVEHGVGRYMGLQRLDAGGVAAEYLVLEYAKQDKIYVPVASLNLIHRYTGGEAETAPLHNLGSDRWSKAQAKAREQAHDVAAELLQIQARRMARHGTALNIDADDYARFAAGFPFEPTPDQQTAIDAVLADLAAERPMDRVVCGDVGFGKTEVALRAAFVTARAGLQVCVLAPTTLLVEQHAKNFADRFASFPLRVAALSRMRSKKEQTEILQQLADGRLDVVIGTHRLLQEDVQFKNLGLVIVDEEHRFGVRHKERLKNLRAEVDLLTLTATPIPRTLNMGLAGLRELSIIATPPPSRLAIKTQVSEWNNVLVQEACLRELRRGGQVYILHNEVKDIEHFARNIAALVPEASVRFAHGQMRERELEQVMLDFYHQRFNVLVCTTIIESGIDVPSANTILIDRADQLGLAQLHQLRGRVGRSHQRGYAYLLVPSRTALGADAQKRLDAIETLGDLGSGFTLATHDLEIRGAGELLGAEQSGQISEVGFTMYAELLARAVKAIKTGKLDDAPFGQTPCEIDLGAGSLIPDDYIPDVHTRLTLYKRISEAASEAELRELKVEMIDRFGLLPPAAERLFEAAELRALAQAMGIEKVRASSSSITLEFGKQPDIDPTKLFKLIQGQPKNYKLEGQARLHWRGDFEAVETRAPQAQTLLATLRNPPQKAA